MKGPFEKVMVALDYEYPEQAFRLVDEVAEVVDWFKVGPMLFVRSGHQIIEFLHRRNKKIFLDLKLHDTPSVIAETVKQIADLGVQFTTVHCSGGQTMLEAAGFHCRGTQLKLLGVTVLTSLETNQERIQELVDSAVAARLSGVLCSPHEVPSIRKNTLPGFLLVTPGIRIPGEEVFEDDQKRVASPKQAIEWGSDYLVVGRPITRAREPRDVLTRLFDT